MTIYIKKISFWRLLFCYVFQYLGCVEVFESRGMQVCEEAVKTLKAVSTIDSHMVSDREEK